MKAAVVPAPKSKWQVNEVDKPTPDHNQVLIKIGASGLCYTDVHITEGHIPAVFPRTLGHEPVGEIVEIGDAVTTRKVGDRVGVPWVQHTCGRCEWCLRGRTNFCAQQVGTGVQMQGSHAQFMLAYAASTMLLPDSLSYEEAASIFCAGFTVWGGLRWAEPKPGERVAVLGIGGLGHLAVQYAHAAGFETIAISSSSDKEALIKKLGADLVVRDGEALQKAGGADIILHCGNSSKAAVSAIQGLRPDGRMIVMGADTEPISVSPLDLISRRIKIIGSQQNTREHLYEALDFVAKGKVKPMIEVFALNDIVKAYEKVEEGKVRFRAIISMN
jgi:D-arabinose 1-dehydrogenase-like Zn-dependent alcohol dehydrogenase